MRLMLVAVTVFVLGSTGAASPTAAITRANPCCWEALFRQGSVGCGPNGSMRGTVFYADEAKHPRVKAHMQGTIWKGKIFYGDGTFTNRWLGGIRAGTANVVVEPSWLDGQPCLAVQYAPD